MEFTQQELKTLKHILEQVNIQGIENARLVVNLHDKIKEAITDAE